MDNDVKKMINNIAQEILTVFKIEIPIKDIDRAVEVLGGSIQIDTRLNKSGVMKKGSAFTIVLPFFSDERHRRFAVAQQLGHLFLHMGYIVNSDRWKQQFDNILFDIDDLCCGIEKVYQANEFAGAFLMPDDKYKQVMDENSLGNRVNTVKIAEYFDVSISAASLRGQSLGFLRSSFE